MITSTQTMDTMMVAITDTSTIDCRVPCIHHPCPLGEASWTEICQIDGLIRTSHHRRSKYFCSLLYAGTNEYYRGAVSMPDRSLDSHSESCFCRMQDAQEYWSMPDLVWYKQLKSHRGLLHSLFTTFPDRVLPNC